MYSVKLLVDILFIQYTNNSDKTGVYNKKSVIRQEKEGYEGRKSYK